MTLNAQDKRIAVVIIQSVLKDPLNPKYKFVDTYSTYIQTNMQRTLITKQTES